MHKKTGNHIFPTDFRSFSASTRGRGASSGRTFRADRSEAETELFEARRASNKKSGWGMKCLIHFFSSNVHERIRTSDLPLRSSPEFCLSRYHKLSNIACFQGFWMVRIACSYHCFHLIPVRRMPSLLPPCCKAQKFSRTSSVSISTI